MNNKYPQISFVFDRRKKANPTTKSSVDMRICYDYKEHLFRVNECTGIDEVSLCIIYVLEGTYY